MTEISLPNPKICIVFNSGSAGDFLINLLAQLTDTRINDSGSIDNRLKDMTDEEPTVTFTISNNKDAYISFTSKQNGKRFKLFARELSEEGKKLREHNLKSVKNES